MLSKYNIYIKEENKIIIYNNFKKRLITIFTEEFLLLKDGKLLVINPILYKKLIKLGIVYEGYNETQYLIDFFQEEFNKRLDIMIMASTCCNFDCEYCYEDFLPKLINSQFEDAFINFLEKNIHEYKSLFIEWFGGEPMLAAKNIIEISKRAMECCKKNNIPFLASITTNGYLLDFETFSKMIDGNIVFFQVTIDGNQEWHDRYRPLKNGHGTYNVIFNNLLSIKKNIPSSKMFNITIRNNVSKDNEEACRGFTRVFEESFGDDNRFQLFQYPIKDWGGDKIKSLKNKLIKSSWLHLNDTGRYRNDIFESIEGSCCLAGKKNGFVIDPEYKVYKCNHYIQREYIGGDCPNQVGLLTLNGDLVIDKKKNKKWYQHDILEECMDCKFLPNCLTQCPLKDIKPTRRCKEENEKELKLKLIIFLKKNKDNWRGEFFE